MKFAAPARALVTAVPDAFAGALRADPSPLDVPRARRQHADDIAALEAIGIAVEALPPDERFADGCFVEDAAVVTETGVVWTRPGAPSRRREPAALSHTLIDRLPVAGQALTAGRLEGGDVLRVGDRLFVGLSSRTDAAGIAALAAACPHLRVQAVPVADGLHLESGVTALGPDAVVGWSDWIDLAPFVAAGLEVVAAVEPAGANVLALGPTVLASAAAPQTAARLAATGRSVEVVDVSEFHRADGALTCLSLRFPRDGHWCV